MPDERALMIAEIEVLYHKYEDAIKNFMKALDEVSSEEFLAPHIDEIAQKQKNLEMVKGTPHEHKALEELAESICKFVKAVCDKLAPAQQAVTQAQANHIDALNKAGTDPGMKKHCDAQKQRAEIVMRNCEVGFGGCIDKIINSSPALKKHETITTNSLHEMLKGIDPEIILDKTKEGVMNSEYRSIRPIETKGSYAESLKPASSKVQSVENSRQHLSIKTH